MANHKHTLTFSGELPADEMDRANLYAKNPEINASRVALVEAFKKSVHPHEAVSHVTRPRADAGQPRKNKGSPPAA